MFSLLFLLACYPFEGQDPFIIKEMPDIFFASNQSSFQTSVKINKNGNYLNFHCFLILIMFNVFICRQIY